MERKANFRFLSILCPFSKYWDLPAEYYTAWRLENINQKTGSPGFAGINPGIYHINSRRIKKRPDKTIRA
jgi:hypothetical protein